MATNKAKKAPAKRKTTAKKAPAKRKAGAKKAPESDLISFTKKYFSDIKHSTESKNIFSCQC